MEEKTKFLENKFYCIYLIGFLLILALPLLNIPPWFSPPDWGKTVVFRIILSILIFVFFWQVLSKKQIAIKTSLAFWNLIALFGIYLLATIFSLDRSFSLWGSPYRSEGFVNLAFYIFFTILAFLILEKRSWRKLWDFTILIGILVSIIAIFQQFGLFENFFTHVETRPPSTIGSPIPLGIYLLLLSFLTLSFGIKEKNLFKKTFYFLSFLLFFLIIIFITQTRAAIIGLFLGLLFFILFYPFKKRLISLGLKITIFILLVLGTGGFYYLNVKPFPSFIQKNKILSEVTQRFLVKKMLGDVRISCWKVSLLALKEKPVLGYGPENFSIGFEKNYDPILPGLKQTPGSSSTWWDRAHNFFLDIGVTAGIPALAIYLSLFIILFCKLQKFKKDQEKNITTLGIQSTFIAYLIANFFSIDAFSTYLISFLLIGYSLFIVNENFPKKNFSFNIRGGYLIIAILFAVLIWFVWNFNIKPLQINTQINISKYLSENNNCEQAIERMEKTLAKGETFLDSYLRQKYVDYLQMCATPENNYEFAKKGQKLLKEAIEIQPYYTRNWIFLGEFTNVLVASEKDQKIKEDLKNEANSYFEKANELSPKRQEVFGGWIKTDFLSGEYQKAKEKSQKCINLNPELRNCWWQMGLSNIYLNDLENAEKNINIASSMGYNINSKNSLSELINAYYEIKNYKKIAESYKILVTIDPNNASYHASLASTYKELGEYKKAKDEALKTLELAPGWKEDVEDFLKTLP